VIGGIERHDRARRLPCAAPPGTQHEVVSRLAFVVAVATLAAGCLIPGFGSPKALENLHSSGGSAGGGAKYCAVYPHLWTSWQAPVKLPPSCPYEGWVRQVVRDIHDIDGCTSDRDPELRIVLGIDKRGVLTSVDVTQPVSEDIRRCVNQALRGWELASAESAGSLLVVYRPGHSA